MRAKYKPCNPKYPTYFPVRDYGPGKTVNRFFFRIGTKRDIQFNLKRYWCGFGLKTNYVSFERRKRFLNFGIGYISWRIK